VAGLARFGVAVTVEASAVLRTGSAGVLVVALLRLTGVGSPVVFLVVTMWAPELQTEGES
jgi:hypothetical protein